MFTFDQIERGEVIPASVSLYVPMDFASTTYFAPYVA